MNEFDLLKVYITDVLFYLKKDLMLINDNFNYLKINSSDKLIFDFSNYIIFNYHVMLIYNGNFYLDIEISSTILILKEKKKILEKFIIMLEENNIEILKKEGHSLIRLRSLIKYRSLLTSNKCINKFNL